MKENDVESHGLWGGVKLARVAVLAVGVWFGGMGMGRAEQVSVADCVRDAEIDVWAAADVEFCRKVMGEVFELAGVEPVKAGFGTDGVIAPEEVEVVCSAFRTPELVETYDFPLQPLGRMHYALYTTPDRAELMLSMKITDWPRMKVAYSPVSQGRDRDRESYFEHAGLSPEYVEYHSSAEAVEAVRKGEVDVLFLYTPFGKRPEELVEIVPIGSRNVYFAVRKDRPELFKRLRAAYREWYIENIERYDAWREEALGIRPPQRRVRVAAYSRGDLFQVSPDGQRSGLVEEWIRSLCAIAHWSPDYVYGDYDESVADVKSGRLDLVGGLGFSPARGKALEFPHTPIGMLRVYLWAHQDSPYQAGKPETWTGMRIGLLGGTLSAQRVKQRLEEGKYHNVTLRDYPTDRELLDAYFAGEVDAVVNIEMEELANERALRLYTSHPMYLVSPRGKPELARELEEALDVVCEDYPKYSSLVMERHYGAHSEMSEMSIHESEWLEERLKDPTHIVIDFSPWPFSVCDAKGQPQGLPKALLSELQRHTGLKFDVSRPQTGIHTAEAKFMRGDTDFWVPFPERPDASAAYGAVEVFSLPVPQSCIELYGAADFRTDFTLLTHSSTPVELVSILRKTMESIPSQQWSEMFMAAAAGRLAERTFFGLTDSELREYALSAAGVFGALLLVYGVSLIVLLKRQARLAHAAAHQANETSMAKSRFLAMMSHELRTPLNAVIGFAEFLCQENALESKRREWVQGILASASALLDLINDILDLSKLEIGSMNMRAGVCRVSEVIGELPAIFGHRVKEKGVGFSVHKTSEGDIPALRLSRQGMRQVLINLVGNSAKFTQGGRIDVEYGWEAATGTLRMVVRDTGCGITAEKMARLFDPFVQDISSRMYEQAGNTNKGTGLGLPIVKRLVDSAGGTIRVDSRLGEGTRFTIEIPGLETVAEEGSAGTAVGAGVHAAETAPAAAAAPAKGAGPVRVPKSVLVVDDIAMNRKVLGIHLGKLGVGEIRCAENGAKALEAMSGWLPDVVLSDIWMPEMDGQQLSEAMHRDARLSAVPIVAITADVEVETTHDTKHFAKVLSKPITSAKIAALFEELAAG